MSPDQSRSLIHDYPDYEVVLEAHPDVARASLEGAVIAESERSVLLRETRHEAVIYFPREDVHWDRLAATDRIQVEASVSLSQDAARPAKP